MVTKGGGSVTRAFVYVDVVDNGAETYTLLFRTESGTLITEKVLLRQVREQITHAMDYFDSPHERKKLTVVVTVDAVDMMDTSPANGEEAQKE